MDMPTVRDAIVKNAQNLPDLIERAKVLDPPLAASLEEKSLIGSKAVWFPPIAAALVIAVGYYGLKIDMDTVMGTAGILSYGVSVVVRYFTRSPIGSILPPTPQKAQS